MEAKMVKTPTLASVTKISTGGLGNNLVIQHRTVSWRQLREYRLLKAIPKSYMASVCKKEFGNIFKMAGAS